MYYMGINIWPVLAAAVATMVIGFLWYSPALFAKPWTRLMGYDLNDKARMAEMQRGAAKMYALTFVATLVSAAMLAKIIAVTTVNSPLYGVKIGLAIWLGFVTTVQLTNALFNKKPAKLYLIDTGYQLVCYAVMGAIIAMWNR
ncbi:MAG: DUF1761 domain-containing protein [Acidobacteriales bacterium]|nr:DUF1761 domain-containing protein [Terriglobales bacterium]